MFRKIAAKESIFIEAKLKHKEFLSNFEKYVEQSSIKAGRITKSKSGKAHSYVGYLLRMLIITEEYSGIKINDLYSVDSYELIDNMRRLEGYRDYNLKEGRFPNAAINSYLAFITQYQMNLEKQLDDKVDQLTRNNEESRLSDTSLFIYKETEPVTHPILREEKVNYLGYMRYPRKVVESIRAKEIAKWKCEIDGRHETFINENNNKPYIEGHHLIPMAVQDLYKYSIDFAGNITCLCPTCHRKIHFAKKQEKIEMVSFLFEKKQHLYIEHAIDIDKDNLMIYYNVHY